MGQSYPTHPTHLPYRPHLPYLPYPPYLPYLPYLPFLRNRASAIVASPTPSIQAVPKNTMP
jgi:hypothetical protein